MPEFGTKGFVIKSYMEDDIVHVCSEINDFEEAVEKAMCFDCEEFDNYKEDYEETLGYEPSCLVSVEDVATGTCMFWSNTDGDFGSDYTGEEGDKFNVVIDKYMR